MCLDAHLPTNAHSILVRQTPTSSVRLARNQAHAGYSLVILREHVTDLTDLTPAQLAGFWTDVQHTSRAIQQRFAPKKIDYLVMGTACHTCTATCSHSTHTTTRAETPTSQTDPRLPSRRNLIAPPGRWPVLGTHLSGAIRG